MRRRVMLVLVVVVVEGNANQGDMKRRGCDCCRKDQQSERGSPTLFAIRLSIQ